MLAGIISCVYMVHISTEDIFYNKNAIANSLETVLELKDDAEVIAEELAKAIMPRLQIQEAQKQRNDFVR